MKTLTAERLREVLHYDAATGLFEWIRPLNRRIRVGDTAGGPYGNGYFAIKIDGRNYYAHRLAWLYVHGVWPSHQIDHKDTVRSHNWIDNLRPATSTENHQNQRRTRDSRTGVLGVCWEGHCRRFVARLKHKGKQVYRSSHVLVEDAIAARLTAEAKFFAFSRGGDKA